MTATDDRASPWPGNREPDYEEVGRASEIPESKFLRDFKEALLSSKDNEGCISMIETRPNNVISRRSSVWTNSNAAAFKNHDQLPGYTYPLSVLADFPHIPPFGHLRNLRSIFFTTFAKHVFLRDMSVPGAYGEILPPHLNLAYACLATCLSGFPSEGLQSVALNKDERHQQSEQLFHAAAKLFIVMTESDNSESRTLEAPLAVSLITAYGSLTVDPEIWNLTSSLLSYLHAMTRRMRLHDSNTYWLNNHDTSDTQRKTSFMCYLLLCDVVRAMHCDMPPAISTSELSIRMPSSPHNFDKMYAKLLSDPADIPRESLSSEDALLLLLALLTDHLYFHHRFKVVGSVARHKASGRCDFEPHMNLPLSLGAEGMRIQAVILSALDGWFDRFRTIAAGEVMALYYYCRMIVDYPNITDLPRSVGYPRAAIPSADSFNDSIVVPKAAWKYAWQILDHVRIEESGMEMAISIWLPQTVFVAALVVWRQTQSDSFATMTSSRILDPFISELKKLPWPCCEEMVSTLKRITLRSKQG